MQKGTTCKYSSTSVAAKVTAFDWTMPYPNATVSMTYLQNEGPLPSAIKILDSIYNYAYDENLSLDNVIVLIIDAV